MRTETSKEVEKSHTVVVSWSVSVAAVARKKVLSRMKMVDRHMMRGRVSAI